MSGCGGICWGAIYSMGRDPKSEWFRVVGDFDKCLNFVKLEKNLQKFENVLERKLKWIQSPRENR